MGTAANKNRRSDRRGASRKVFCQSVEGALLGAALLLSTQGLLWALLSERWVGVQATWGCAPWLGLLAAAPLIFWLGAYWKASKAAPSAAWHRSDERKDLFMAMLGHELRNPLAGISSAAQVLGHPAAKPEQLTRAAQIVERQVKHMTHLVDDLLDVSRVTRGQIQLEKSPVEVAAVVDGAVEQAQGLISAKQHQLTVIAPEHPVLVMGDLTRLVQAVTNLLVNAARYTQPGGQLAVTWRATEQEAEIAVQDNGAGIAPDLVAHVFDFFVQAKRSSDRIKGGLGLGLSLVKNLVEAHGGQITLVSAGPGLGSTFTITLPCLPSTDPSPQLPVAAPSNAGPSPALTIAVVDDNADAARPLAMLLELYGHRATVFPTAEALLTSVRDLLPDVCIIDLGLPGMDGCTLATQLRQLPELVHTALVALTGLGTEADKLRTMQAGFDQHFVKPVSVATLLDALDLLHQATLARGGASSRPGWLSNA